MYFHKTDEVCLNSHAKQERHSRAVRRPFPAERHVEGRSGFRKNHHLILVTAECPTQRPLRWPWARPLGLARQPQLLRWDHLLQRPLHQVPHQSLNLSVSLHSGIERQHPGNQDPIYHFFSVHIVRDHTFYRLIRCI